MTEQLKFNGEDVKETRATNAFKEELKSLEKTVDNKTAIKEIQINVVTDFLNKNKDKDRSYWTSAEGNNEGRSGKIVTAVQIALKDFGFNPGTIDGKFGPKTKGALDDFKKLAKISENNIGKKTIEKIIENIGASKDKRIIGLDKTLPTASKAAAKEEKEAVKTLVEEDLTKKENNNKNEFFRVIIGNINKKGLLNNENNFKTEFTKKYGEKDNVIKYFNDKKISIRSSNDPYLSLVIKDKNNQTNTLLIDSKICMKDGKFNQELLLKIIHQKLEKKMTVDLATQKNLDIYKKQNKVIEEIRKMSKKYTIDNLGFTADEKDSLALQRIFADFEDGKVEFNNITKDNLVYGTESKKINIQIDCNNSRSNYNTTRKFEEICDSNGNFNEKKFQERLKRSIKGLAEANYKL